MSTKFSWELHPASVVADFGDELNNELPPLVRNYWHKEAYDVLKGQNNSYAHD